MKKRKISKFQIYLMINSLVLSWLSFGLVQSVLKHDILPLKYLVPLLFFVILVPLVLIIVMLRKKNKKKIRVISSILSILLIGIYSVFLLYLSKTYKFIENIVDDGYVIENYSVIVLNNDKYNSLKDIENKLLGYYKDDSTGVGEALDKLDNEIKIDKKDYKDYNSLIDDLYNEKVDSLIMEESYRTIIEETKPDFNDKTKVIHKIEVKRKKEDIVKNVDVKNETFNMYISGIDVYGSISSVSRSDVNIVASVNPSTHQMLLISIPRDYYVQLDGTTGYKDKLTHAGIYGIDKSVKTLENLLGIEINYYIKVNFSSVERMIDAIGGVDVYSKYTFIGYEDSSFKQGFNRVNGKQGLEFARTRKTVQGGDRTRGENQEALIQAILKKVTSKEIITKYTGILNSLNGTFQTNMPMDTITDLIKKQISDMASWTVTSISLDGYDASRYTYSYPGQYLYVMEPDEDSIVEAKQKLKDISDGLILEGSYSDNVSGKVNVPVTVAQPVESQPIVEPPKEEVKEEEKVEKKDETKVETDEDTTDEKTKNDDEAEALEPTIDDETEEKNEDPTLDDTEESEDKTTSTDDEIKDESEKNEKSAE